MTPCENQYALIVLRRNILLFFNFFGVKGFDRKCEMANHFAVFPSGYNAGSTLSHICHLIYMYMFHIDLMLPGVIPQQDGLPQLSKGQLCAITLIGNQAAVAIGHAAMATVDMVTSGMKGKGVQVIHCFKDMLW